MLQVEICNSLIIRVQSFRLSGLGLKAGKGHCIEVVNTVVVCPTVFCYWYEYMGFH